MLMRNDEGELCLELALEQLKRIGFKGDPKEEVKTEGWYSRNQWPTKKMEEDFRAWAIKKIRKRTLYTSEKTAGEVFAWFNLSYGLRSAEDVS